MIFTLNKYLLSQIVSHSLNFANSDPRPLMVGRKTTRYKLRMITADNFDIDFLIII